MLVVRCCDPSCKVENPARGMPKHPIHVPTMGNIRNIGNIVQTAVGEYYAHRSEGFALTGYDIPGCVEDGAWMLRENYSVVTVAAAVAHPDFENGNFSSFITESELPECADRSVLSSEYRWSRN